jgi:F-type H+-transporting ATPase subunit epsilon
MAGLQLTVVTAERALLDEGNIDFISAPGSRGRLGILPQHTPLLTTLDAGDLFYRRRGEETHFAVSGGFMEIAEDHIIVLADTAERADEIDEARAEESRQRAAEILRRKDELSQEELLRAETSLRKAATRLQVARYRRQRPGTPPRPREPMAEE